VEGKGRPDGGRRAFAGDDYEPAIVEDAGRQALSRWGRPGHPPRGRENALNGLHVAEHALIDPDAADAR
jgi:hypothetical protein